MAEENGKIYITISDKAMGGGGESEKPTEKKKEKTLGEYSKHAFFSFIKQEANTMINYSISNIGNFTGDFQMQRDVQVAVQVVGLATNLATSFIAGMTLSGGNVAGGLVAMGISLAAQTINYGLGEITGQLQNRNQNYNIAQLRNISGLDTLTNGSR